MKNYKYTILKQDGTTEVIPGTRKLSFSDFYKILNCQTIEVIPHAYCPDGSGKATFYGDEEGRFVESNKRNPHMKVLKGNPDIGEPLEWDCVGDIIKEEVERV